jgi:hypothetical protein
MLSLITPKGKRHYKTDKTISCSCGSDRAFPNEKARALFIKLHKKVCPYAHEEEAVSSTKFMDKNTGKVMKKFNIN